MAAHSYCRVEGTWPQLGLPLPGCEDFSAPGLFDSNTAHSPSRFIEQAQEHGLGVVVLLSSSWASQGTLEIQ